MSGRGFDFSEATKDEVHKRQRYVCARCGKKLTGREEHPYGVHHVIPDLAGDKDNTNHAFMATADNAVALCHECHKEAHEDGKYKHGALPYSFRWYRYSHGRPINKQHYAWIKKLEELAPLVWSKFSK